MNKLFELVDRNGDGALGCEELRYDGCGEGEWFDEHGFVPNVTQFDGLLRQLADDNGQDAAEFLDGALAFQEQVVAKEREKDKEL